MDKKWKLFRRIFSTLFFIIITLSIILVIPFTLYDNLISSQLGPVILKLTTGAQPIIFGGLILLIVLIILLGRTYCSFLCPLGYLHDIAIRIGKFAGIESSLTIQKKRTAKILRLSLLLVITVMFFAGYGFFTGLLEPFSIYFRTVFLVSRGQEFHIFISISLVSSLIILLSTSLIVLLSAKTGRFFCSWVCPVGTILWGLSFISIFKLKINKPLCTGCNKCLESCKSGAIDDHWEKIDTALCVGCLNCLSVCETGAIEVKRKSGKINVTTPTPKDLSVSLNEADDRRRFLKQLVSGILVLSIPFDLSGVSNENEKHESILNKRYVFPPGGEDHDRFIRNCTGCMVCARKCPTNIIYSSVGLSFSSPVLPILNFKNGYCTEDCIECSRVCPTGALKRLSVGEKKTTKIADLQLNLNKCLIYTNSLECNVCAEICPVDAIKMIPRADSLFPVPMVVQKDCIGCGKCLFRCPAKKREAIFIFSLYGSN